MEETEGSKMWHQLYNWMSWGLFPPFSQRLSSLISQNPQIFSTQQLGHFAGNLRAHGLSLPIAEENNQVTPQPREGISTEV